VKVGPLVVAGLLAIYLVGRWRRVQLENRILGAVAVAALAVYGSGLVHFPSLDSVLKNVGEALGPYTYVLVAVMAFAETGAFIGLVAPGETVVIVGGVVAGQGQIDIIALIALVWVCAVAGDSVSFWLGRRLGREFLIRHGARVRITEERLKQVEGFLHRHGGPTILIGRFIGFVRPLAPFVAGASRMPYRRFIPYDVIAAGLWSAVFCLLGFVFWHSLDQVLSIAKKGAFALGTVIGVVVAGVVLYRYLREERNRKRVRAWLETQAERPALRPVVRVLRPVWRRVGLPAWRAAMPGLRFLWNRLTPGNLGLELTTLLAAMTVGGFAFGALGSLISDQRALSIDGTGFDVASSLRTSAGIHVAKVVTDLGALPAVAGVVGVVAIFLLMNRRPFEALALLGGLALTVVAVDLAKEAFDRPRPPGALVSTEGKSYPSGHSAYATAYVAVAVAVGHAFRRFAAQTALVVGAIVLTAAVGATRVYLRAHYVSDVLGGYGLAAVTFGLWGIVAVLVAFLRHNARSA
jgi:membrane protein DedA with SNARE-associated domain/membrane-associated phospholipid phosphatase